MRGLHSVDAVVYSSSSNLQLIVPDNDDVRKSFFSTNCQTLSDMLNRLFSISVLQKLSHVPKAFIRSVAPYPLAVNKRV